MLSNLVPCIVESVAMYRGGFGKMTEEHGRKEKKNIATDVDPALLDEIIRRITEVTEPERIVLFGSAARGQHGPYRDLDILVIKSDVPHRRRLAQQIHLNLFGIGVPIDIIVVTPEDVLAFRDREGTVIKPAIQEGIEIYAA